jgi:penicillin-binding protein 2
VGITDEVNADGEALPGEDLRTFKMKGTAGREGIELKYDEQLQGEAGGAVYRVNNTGIRLGEPIAKLQPKQGKHITLSLDIDMQLAAEQLISDTNLPGGAVAVDVATGEVLVLASKPDYDLSQFSPRISRDTWNDARDRGAFYPRAISGLYPPGSSFKILTSIAGLRSGNITPGTLVTCPGFFRVGNRVMDCHDRHAHGTINLVTAVELSCNVFFYQTGLETGVDAIAAEAKRFHLDRPTGIELANETHGMVVPDPEWKEKNRGEKWLGGDTAQMAIGQNALILTPLQMACFAASVARNEVWTQPTLLHDPNRPRQKTEPIGLTAEQRAVLLKGMQQVALTGTAKLFQKLQPSLGGLTIAAKTGTAQKQDPKGMINFAWLIAFAPIENPQIALAIALEGDSPGEETGGGRYATPVAHAIFKTWLEKKSRPSAPRVQLKGE